MKKINISLGIEDNIQAGLDSGELIRTNGVIRDALTKQIVQIPPEIPTVEETGENSLSIIEQALKNFHHNKPLLYLSTMTVVSGIAGVAHYTISKKKNNERKKLLFEEFFKALDEYKEAAINDSIAIENINDLNSKLDKIKLSISEGKIKFTKSETDLFNKYVDLLFDYIETTDERIKHIENNNQTENDKFTKNTIKLEDYLNYQKDKIESA